MQCCRLSGGLQLICPIGRDTGGMAIKISTASEDTSNERVLVMAIKISIVEKRTFIFPFFFSFCLETCANLA